MSEINAILPILAGIKQQMETMNKTFAQMNKTQAIVLSEEWITPSQVMFTMKICKRTLEKLKGSGQLPFSKINGLIYFNVTDIANLFKANYVITSTATNLDSPFYSKSNVSTTE